MTNLLNNKQNIVRAILSIGVAFIIFYIGYQFFVLKQEVVPIETYSSDLGGVNSQKESAQNTVTIDQMATASSSILSKSSITPHKTTVRLGDMTFIADISDSEALREQGLSGRTGLQDNEGMIFIFPKADTYGFWMKDMNFSLDIIWTDESGTILSIERSLSPQTYPRVYYPTQPSCIVFEVNAGTVERVHIKIGDKLIFDKNILKNASN